MIFFVPVSPCSCHCWSFGITTVSSCMMIELVMYGMIPSEKTARRVSAPPENRLMMPRNPPDLARRALVARIPMSTTGTGTCEPNRKTAMMNSVKRIFARRSGNPERVEERLEHGRLRVAQLSDLGGSSGRLDLLFRCLGERVRLHGQLLVEVAPSERP